MSGGSYNYLCYKAAEDLFSYTVQESLRQMAERLAELGYAQDAARETEELLCIVRQCTVRLEVRIKRLTDIWRAVEWCDSGDSSENGIKEELATYRASGAD